MSPKLTDLKDVILPQHVFLGHKVKLSLAQKILL